MSDHICLEDIYSQVVDLLSKLERRHALSHQCLRATILDFIQQDQTGFRDELSIHSKTKSKKRPRPDDFDLTLRAQATRFLADESLKDRRPDVKTFFEALERLKHGSSVPPEVYTSLLGEERGSSDTGRPIALGDQTRQKSVMQKYDRADEQSHFWESIRRLSLLWVVYEIERLQPGVKRKQTRAGRRETAVAAAERMFSELSDVPVQRVRDVRKRARVYVDIAAHPNGLGILLILGTQCRDFWENRITDTAASLIWQFCNEHLEGVLRAAETLQPVACEMLKRQFTQCDINPFELHTNGHLFSRHFGQQRTAGTCNVQNTTLEVLAAVAANELHTGHVAEANDEFRRDSASPSNLRFGDCFGPQHPSRSHSDNHAASAASMQVQGSATVVPQKTIHHGLHDSSIEVAGTPTGYEPATESYPYATALQDWQSEDLDDFLREWNGPHDTFLTL